jgi:hypothetical protein
MSIPRCFKEWMADGVAERIAEGRLFQSGFGPGVDALNADFGILGPVGDQAPAELGDFEVGGSGPDDGGTVGGTDERLGFGRDGDLLLADFDLLVFAGLAGAHELLVEGLR